MKKIPILICLLVLIGLGVGCNLNKKDDHQVLKDKFRVLKPIYPMDKIEGLFSRFPKGFKILNIRNEKGERIEIELDGDPQTKKITGHIMEKKLRSGEPDLEVLNKEIYYQDGEFRYVDNGEVPDLLKDFKFLFQVYDIDNFLSIESEPVALRNWRTAGTSDYSLVHDVSDDLLADYIKVPRGTELRISVGGDFDADAKGKFKKYIRVWKVGLGKSVFEMIAEDQGAE
ncbi:hypothetical protein [Abiotrophia defectiva]|jgi:hypothetical protein|uniref:hypothetical protein n=1 Tax=Abiotrophia defectiva TaxID=46125 RepID=UPI003C782600